MAFKLGTLVLELAANSARLQADMGKVVAIAERGASQIKSAFTFVTAGVGGGLIGSALIGAAKSAIELGDNLNKAAIKAGTGGKAMSELAYAAKLADVDLASLSTGLRKMQVSLSQAGSGAKEPIAALAALGLKIGDLQRLKPEDQFELIGDRIDKLTDPADRARAAVELFGKAGADLLPLFADGAEGIRKARMEAEKIGFSFDEKQLKALADADDAIKRLKAAYEALATTLAAKVAPSLTTAVNSLTTGELTKGFSVFKSPIAGIVSLYDQVINQPRTPNDAYDANRRGVINRGSATPPKGFAAAEAAAALAKEQQDYVDKFAANVDDIDAMLAKSADDELKAANDSWTDQMLAWQKFEDDRAEAEKETNDQIQKWRDEQSQKLSEGAQIFKDAWINAIDDMINTGSFKIDEFFKYIVAEFAKRGIAKLFDQIFSGQSSSGGGGDGWLDSVAGAITGAIYGGGGTTGADDFVNTFGPGKASGGSVSAGTIYPVGERGMELFKPKVDGAIIPNNKLGGARSIVISPTYHINNPDNTARLPEILAENNRRIFDILDREMNVRRA